MHAALRALADRQHAVFTAGQALDAGYSVEEIQVLRRKRTWSRVRRGVYVDGQLFGGLAGLPRELHLLQCAALQLVLQRPFVFSHWSAGRLHDLDFLGRPPEDVCGTDPDEARRGRGYRICGATLPPEHVTTLQGWPLTTGARTVVDLAREVSFRSGVVIADSALRARAATPEDLRAAVLYCSHFQGIGRAARVCSFADGRAESVLESVSRIDLVARGLPVPELQPEIYDDHGLIGRSDMLWEDYGVVGEADGKVKYTQPYAERRPDEVLWAEKRRMSRLEAAGLAVVRWTSEELRQAPQRIVERFWLAARRSQVAAPSYRIVSHNPRTSRAV